MLTGLDLPKCNSRNEHEFVVYEFTNNEKHKLEFRVARGREDNMRVSPFSSESSLYLAVHTITRINGDPPLSKVLRTITFKGDRATHPSLWDVMILANVVHHDSDTFTLLGRQCYWFADTIFGLLEKWASIHKNGIMRPEEKKWRRGLASTGRLGVVPVHHRNTVLIDEIWNKFMEERRIMDCQVGVQSDLCSRPAALTGDNLARWI